MTKPVKVHDQARRDALMALIRKEHPSRASHALQALGMLVIGTGYLVTYRIENAFPRDKINRDEYRVAFMHEDGIIWDRSTRFPDPGAST